MGKVDFFKKLGSGLGRLAPTVAGVLATAAGGPAAGALARHAVGSIASALGLPEGTKDPETVLSALEQATPEQIASIKQSDQAFELELKKLGLKTDELHAQDRASARQMQIATKDRMPAYIATAALVGFFAILLSLIFVAVPEQSQRPLDIMLGALVVLVAQVGAFYFGSSKSSQVKGESMDRLLRKE